MDLSGRESELPQTEEPLCSCTCRRMVTMPGAKVSCTLNIHSTRSNTDPAMNGDRGTSVHVGLHVVKNKAGKLGCYDSPQTGTINRLCTSRPDLAKLLRLECVQLRRFSGIV
jgi:hypothetical protein